MEKKGANRSEIAIITEKPPRVNGCACPFNPI